LTSVELCAITYEYEEETEDGKIKESSNELQSRRMARKVGEWRGAGVFWSPSNPGDYALEIDGDCLYPLEFEAVKEVEFFSDKEDRNKMREAIKVNPDLFSSLPRILLVEILKEEQNASE